MLSLLRYTSPKSPAFPVIIPLSLLWYTCKYTHLYMATQN